MSELTYHEGMINAKRRKLVARGWKVGDAAEFVGLTDEERAYVDLKVRLADGVRRQRTARA